MYSVSIFRPLQTTTCTPPERHLPGNARIMPAARPAPATGKRRLRQPHLPPAIRRHHARRASPPAHGTRVRETCNAQVNLFRIRQGAAWQQYQASMPDRHSRPRPALSTAFACTCRTREKRIDQACAGAFIISRVSRHQRQSVLNGGSRNPGIIFW